MGVRWMLHKALIWAMIVVQITAPVSGACDAARPCRAVREAPPLILGAFDARGERH
jgi:hypothetical protein